MAPPRSVADATRFTPTGPHAFTNPANAAGSNGETPQQRVARLRAAAQAARAENISTFDRILDRGRVWADRAHRITALGLIGATVLCGGITIFAFTDMVIYNRRRKREFAMEQKALKEAESIDTRESVIATAVASGITESEARAATEAAEKAELEASKPKPISSKIKDWAMKGLTPADQEHQDRFAREEEDRRIHEKAATAAVVEVNKAGFEKGDNLVGRPGADELVKGRKEGGGTTGFLSSITGWWSGR
ncbi:hypothetical protein RUND412_000260 [Rhizina undulata]